jgi:uncharacterized membrane protein YhaH (DUF805 family)
MRWYLQALKKYAVFGGRARRREYWIFEWGNTLILIALVVIGRLADPKHVGLLPSLFIVAMIIPSFASLVRRLHDTNRSGWWLLATLVPVIGQLIILSFIVTDSQPGANRYGPNPKRQPTTQAAGSPEMGYLAPPIDRR